MVTTTLLRVTSSAARAEQRALSMDQESFGALYEKTARPLRAYLCHVTRNEACADDLLQETYYRLLTAELPQMDESQTRRYLFRIATNLAHDRWRRHESDSIPELPDVAAGAVDLDLKHDMRVAMAALKPRERQMLWLAYVEGWKHDEIAAAMGLKARSIRLLLFRARRRLARAIRPGEPEEELLEKKR